MSAPCPQPRKARLSTSAEAEVSLIYYPAGLHQPLHTHRGPQMSILLAGGFRETTPEADSDPATNVSAMKADGARHAVMFGPHGALMLGLDLHDTLDVSLRQAGDWRPMDGATRALTRALVHAGGPSDDLVCDLMIAIRHAPLAPLRQPPAGVKRLRDALDDAPAEVDFTQMARATGMHRVCLSRLFTAAYGLPPSLYRQRRMASHALALACGDGLSLAQAAAEAGFADQSHLTRTFRRHTGFNLSDIRRRLPVTSVQDSPRLHT